MRNLRPPLAAGVACGDLYYQGAGRRKMRLMQHMGQATRRSNEPNECTGVFGRVTRAP